MTKEHNEIIARIHIFSQLILYFMNTSIPVTIAEIIKFRKFHNEKSMGTHIYRYSVTMMQHYI